MLEVPEQDMPTSKLDRWTQFMNTILLIWPFLPMILFLSIAWLDPVRDTSQILLPILLLSPLWFLGGLLAGIGIYRRLLSSKDQRATANRTCLAISMVFNSLWFIFMMVVFFGPFRIVRM